MKLRSVILVYKNSDGETAKRYHTVGNRALPTSPPMGFILSSIKAIEEDIIE